MRGAALRLDPLGHAGGEAQVVEGDGGLRRHGAQEPPVLARVGLLREARAEHDEADELAADDAGHEVVGRERRERGHERPAVATGELARPALEDEVGEAGRLPGSSAGSAVPDGSQPAVRRAEVRDDRPGPQRPPDLLPEQLPELSLAGDGADPRRQLLEDDPRVVRVAEEGPVDPPGRAADPRGRDRGEGEPEAHARRGGERRVDLEEAREGQGEEGVGGEGQEDEEDAEAAPDEDVPGAALEQHRQLEHAVDHDRVREREREGEQRHEAQRHEPVGHRPAELLRELEGGRGQDADRGSPRDHLDLAARVGRRRAPGVREERGEPQGDGAVAVPEREPSRRVLPQPAYDRRRQGHVAPADAGEAEDRGRPPGGPT